MINYTKGKWKVGKATDAMGYETPIYANTDEGRDYEIATVHIYNGEQIANAQLIASAPLGYELADFVAHISSTWIEEGVLQIGEGDYTRMKTLALDLIRKVNRGD